MSYLLLVVSEVPGPTELASWLCHHPTPSQSRRWHPTPAFLLGKLQGQRTWRAVVCEATERWTRRREYAAELRPRSALAFILKNRALVRTCEVSALLGHVAPVQAAVVMVVVVGTV